MSTHFLSAFSLLDLVSNFSNYVSNYVYYSDNAICAYSHIEEGSHLAQPCGLTEYSLLTCTSTKFSVQL